MTQLATPPAPGGAEIDAQAFRAAMRRPANAVAVVTGAGPEGRVGVTVTAVCSLSDAPPMMLACLHRAGSALPVILQSGAFCVNFLAEGQEDIAMMFAGRGGLRGEARFQDDLWQVAATGAPVLKGALASFDCLLAEELDSPTHAILTGRVMAVTEAPEARPLVYSEGAFAGLLSR